MQPPYRNLLIATGATAVGVFLLYLLLPYTLPFLLAALLTAVIDRPVDYLERRLRLPRGLVVAFVLCAAVVGFGLFMALLIANIAAELEVFYQALPSYSEQWRASLERLLEHVKHFSSHMPHPLDELLSGGLENWVTVLAAGVSGLMGQLQHLPNLFTSLFIAAVTTYFLSRDKRGLAAAYLRLIPAGWHQRLFELKRHIAAGSLGLVRSQVILLCFTFLLATTAFKAFGVGYAWLLGLLTALLDVMPMVGPSGVFLPLIVYMATVDAMGRAIGLALVWAALLLLRQILEVRVMGAQLGVHPLTMIFAIYTGVKLFGANGLWLAPFIVIAVKAVFTVVYPTARV